MERRLVLLLWFVSFLWSGCALAENKSTAAPFLTEEEVANPQFVTDWLKKNGQTTHRKDADWFFDVGLRDKQNKNWSAATKAFGESMIRYPSPQALAEYAEAELRMLGEIRARQKNFDANKLSDLSHALNFFKSALAADSVLNAMPKEDNERVRSNVECLDAYIRSGKAQGPCAALEAYGNLR